MDNTTPKRSPRLLHYCASFGSVLVDPANGDVMYRGEVIGRVIEGSGGPTVNLLSAQLTNGPKILLSTPVINFQPGVVST